MSLDGKALLMMAAVTVCCGGLAFGQQTAAVVPLVGSADGVGGSHFSTMLRIHNHSAVPASGNLVLIPACDPANPATLSYSLAAGETKEYADVMQAFGRSGLASIDIVPLSGETPVGITEITGTGIDGGPYIAVTESVSVDAAPSTGTTLLMLPPANPAAERWNIGVRALGMGATLAVTTRVSSGSTQKVEKTYEANYLEQLPIAAFIGHELAAGETIEIAVTAGNAIVWNASTDNITQQPEIDNGQRVDHVTGTFGTNWQLSPTDNPAVVSTPWTAKGMMAGYGNMTGVAEQTVDFSQLPPLMINSVVFTDESGDQLKLTGRSTSMNGADKGDIGNFAGVWQVKEGTGKFAGMKGTMTFRGGIGSMSSTSGIGFFTISGTLTPAPLVTSKR